MLVITGLAVSGNFSETDNCVGSLDVGASCTITVAFVALGTGGTGAVTITDNASDSPQTLPLNGPNLTAPSAIVSPASLTFASQAIGTTSGPQTTLTNPVNGNTAPLTFPGRGLRDRAERAAACCPPNAARSPRSADGVWPTDGTVGRFDNAPNLQQGVILNGTGR